MSEQKTLAEVEPCNRCGQSLVINPKPHEDIVVCEQCAFSEGKDHVLAYLASEQVVEVREEWGVIYAGTDKVDQWCCRGCARSAAREKGDLIVTRSRTVIRDSITPWTPVEEA